MATISTKPPAAAEPAESVEARFHRLTAEWDRATAHLSSMTAASQHPAYQEIISLGPDVLPYMLRDLEESHRHWFIALRKITGASPIPKSAAGDVPNMVEAWLQWAKENGY
jgi:hypothetical protein